MMDWGIRSKFTKSNVCLLSIIDVVQCVYLQ